MNALVRSVLPLILALIVAALLILLLGKNPAIFFSRVVDYGLLGDNWMRSLTLLAPLLLVAVGLIVVFRGNLWNLGFAGQYLLGAVVVSGFAPILENTVPAWVATIIMFVGALVVGAVWTLIPALLKAKFGTNEIITSLVTSFIAIGVVNMLVKGVFKDPQVASPQTRIIDNAHLLPYIPGTMIHVGLLLALLVAAGFQFLLTRTSFGLEVSIYGASEKAARHVGINATWMVVVLFAISGALIALAGAVDILGEWRYQRANWDPGLGFAALPFVFLARLSPVAAIPLLAFYAVLSTGGTLASQQAGLSTHFQLVILALILLFMTITEYIGTKRALGQNYLSPRLKHILTRPSLRGNHG